MGERQGVQISVLRCFILSAPPRPHAQEQVLEGLSAHVLLKSKNLSVLRKLFQRQALKAPCLGLAM